MAFMLAFVMRFKSESVLRCALLLTTSTAGVLSAQRIEPAPATAVSALSPPYRTATYLFTAAPGTSRLFFSHGYVIRFNRHSTFEGQSNIYLYNSSGQLEHEVAVWPAAAAKLFLTSVDVGTESRLAFAGEATMADGGEFTFIASSDLDGKNPHYFGTGKYRASLIAQADDGSIWAIGAEHYEAVGTTHEWKNYYMLRHYAANGSLLEHFLPRYGSAATRVTNTETSGSDGVKRSTATVYNSEGVPITTAHMGRQWGYSNAWEINRQVYLRSSEGITALFDGVHNQLCEHDTAANTFACANVKGLYANTMSLTGMALTRNGDVLASMKASDASSIVLRGLFLLRAQKTDSQNMQWIVIPGTESSLSAVGKFSDLLGADGNSLVYRQQQDRRSFSTVYESTW